MIASSARLTAPLARQAVRQSTRSSMASPLFRATTQRRMASGSVKAAAEQTKSDAPWAIGSLVVFGSMFIYVTAPPKGGKKGHGHEAEHGSGSSSSSEEEEDSDAETEDTEEENSTYDNVKKIEDKPDSNAPKGSQHLAQNSLTAEDGAHKQKTTKSGSDLQKADDITFKTGVKASKEGHGKGENAHMSDPKKVVADAHTQREDNKEQAKAKKNVENSPEAADANAEDKE